MELRMKYSLITTRRFVSVASIMMILLLSSCLPERKLAQEYVKRSPEINLLVFPTDYLYKFNHKGEAIPGFDSLPESSQDSALWANSTFIRYVNDSILLETYTNSFLGELRAFGFNVFLGDALDSFLTYKVPQSYVITLSQMQIDEYIYPLEDEEAFADTIYYKRFDLNGVDFSNWFELNKVNPDGKRRKVTLYSSHSAFDSFDGRYIFDPWNGGVGYRYKIDSLRVEDLPDMAAYLGRKHASYFYDYFMNQVIAHQLPEAEGMQYYYHYNRFKKSITTTDLDRFEILHIDKP